MQDSAGDLDGFIARMDALIGEEGRNIMQFQQENVRLYRERQQRLAKYEEEIRRLIPTLTPRIRAFTERFKDIVKVERVKRAHTRELVFHFRSGLAYVTLKLSAYPDQDVRNIIFGYDLEIIPILMKYDSVLTLEQPLYDINTAAVLDWLDDRLVAFVRTYLSISNNGYYLRGHQVRDPVADVVFPRHFAAATLGFRGETYYFISQDTRDEFKKQMSCAPTIADVPPSGPAVCAAQGQGDVIE